MYQFLQNAILHCHQFCIFFINQNFNDRFYSIFGKIDTCNITYDFIWKFSGDLKLVEKPQPLTMAPHDFCNIKANVKVASTENGIIFGNIGEY